MPDWSLSELMVCLFAREIEDGSVGVLPGVRSEVPLGAVALAARSHAPNIWLHTVHGDTDALSYSISGTTSDYEGFLASRQYHELADLFDMLHQRSVDWVFYGALQMDQFANINLVCVGDWHHPNLRGPGTAGGASENFAKRFFVWINEHSPRVFVKHVDFVGVPGYETDRSSLGIPGGGPHPIVTPLAVLEVDRLAGKIALASVHPGVTVDQVVENTGFDLIIPADVPTTQEPTDEELAIIRSSVDPKGILRRESLYG